MAEYVLHCFAQSGNAYKGALMLELCSADWEARRVDFFQGETRSEIFRERLNEMGEVPVLEHRGRKLAQSGVILDYLATTFRRYGWRDEDERREILRWLLWDNHKLTSYIATLRFMLQFQGTGETPVTEFLRGRMKSALAILDRHLDGTPFVVAGRFGIADISLCGYLFWNDEFGVTWDDYPNVGDWLERVRATPRWQHPYALMPGHPLPEKR
jgi:glutathione S-transferase